VLAINSGTVGKQPHRSLFLVSADRSSSPAATIRSRRLGRVRQLVGVENRADACDPPACDIEREHADQLLVSVEEEPSRAAVDLDAVTGPRAADPGATRR